MTDPDTIATYQAVADEYRERHADRSVVEAQVEQFLTSVEASTNGARACVADVGCGPGWESATFVERGHEVVGIDLTPAFLRAARSEAPPAAFARMDMRQLGFEDDAFDGLWACASFLHVPRDDAPDALAEFHRTLRPRGTLSLAVKRGDGERGGQAYAEDRRRFTLYRPDELRAMVADAGFTVELVDGDGDTEWIHLLGRK